VFNMAVRTRKKCPYCKEVHGYRKYQRCKKKAAEKTRVWGK